MDAFDDDAAGPNFDEAPHVRRRYTAFTVDAALEQCGVHVSLKEGYVVVAHGPLVWPEGVSVVQGLGEQSRAEAERRAEALNAAEAKRIRRVRKARAP